MSINETSKKHKRNKIIMIVVSSILVIVGIALGVYYGTSSSSGSKTKSTQSKAQPIESSKPTTQQPTPINCKVSAWGEWGVCDTNCGPGTQTRYRTITKSAETGGTCKLSLSESRSCNTQKKCISNKNPNNCVAGAWGEWGVCDTNCGTGTQTRSRTVETPAENGGSGCSPLIQTQSCNENACPTQQGNNCGNRCTPWSSCSLDCGGMQTRTCHDDTNGTCITSQPCKNTCSKWDCTSNGCILSSTGLFKSQGQCERVSSCNTIVTKGNNAGSSPGSGQGQESGSGSGQGQESGSGSGQGQESGTTYTPYRINCVYYEQDSSQGRKYQAGERF